MERKRKDSTDSLQEWKAEADRLFLELTGADRVLRQARKAFRPHADVYVSKSQPAIIIKLELAGIDPGSVHLEAEERVLRVKGERADSGRADKVYQQMEIDYGYFERVFNLPVDIDPSKSTAHYQDGFLEIMLPLPAQSGLRKIPVNVKEPNPGNEGVSGQ